MNECVVAIERFLFFDGLSRFREICNVRFSLGKSSFLLLLIVSTIFIIVGFFFFIKTQCYDCLFLSAHRLGICIFFGLGNLKM